MKRYSIKELKAKKEDLGIMFYDFYTLYSGYKVCKLNNPFEPIGYITYNQFIKLQTKIKKIFYSEKLYVIIK